MQKVKTLLVGLGGYGNQYVNAILDHGDAAGVELVGTVDPHPEACSRYNEVVARSGRAFVSMDEFFEASAADLVVISAPIHLHEPFSIAAMEHGAVVLCEKPAAGSIQAGLAMAAASERLGRPLLIGYQWAFAESFLSLQNRVAAGELGACRRVRGIGFWPRGASYYTRNSWAGRIKTDAGEWILDSPLNNAMAHFVHNPLFVLGQEPVTVQAELYRANPIESFDSVALRGTLSGGTELIFCAAHAVPSKMEPCLYYEFEKCSVFARAFGMVSVLHNDGRIEKLPLSDAPVVDKLRNAAGVVRGEDKAACSITDSLGQLRVVAGAHLSSPVSDLPADLLEQTDDVTWAHQLPEALVMTYGSGKLPSETGNFSWARPGAEVSVRDLLRFEGLGR